MKNILYASESTSLIMTLQAFCFGGEMPVEVPFQQLKEYGLGSWAWYFTHDKLPGPAGIQARNSYFANSALDFKQEVTFHRLETLFEKSGVRYCPIKGADLAWRVYPTGALRPKADLDIFIHPEDYSSALKSLQQDGGYVPYQTICASHYPPMIYHGVSLELHFKLPLTEKCDSGEIWNDLLQVKGCRYQLPLELNLLMLFQHCRQHRWEIVPKLLMDCAFLIRKEGMPDWARIDAFAKRFLCASPALFFAAFPDFFPAVTMPPRDFPTAVCQVFRELMFSSVNLESYKHEIVMSTADRFTFRWFLARLRGMKPGSIRSQTHNPRGNYGKLLAGYWQISRQKLYALWRYRHGTNNEVIQKRLAELDRIEKILLQSREPENHI